MMNTSTFHSKLGSAATVAIGAGITSIGVGTILSVPTVREAGARALRHARVRKLLSAVALLGADLIVDYLGQPDSPLEVGPDPEHVQNSPTDLATGIGEVDPPVE